MNAPLFDSARKLVEDRAGAWLFLVVAFVLLLIPFKVTMYGYLPTDDAMRHVGKVVSGKEWPEILVMRDTYAGQDHNEGWHKVLGLVHGMGFEKDDMILFSVIGLFLAFAMSGLYVFRKTPEVWPAVLFVMTMAGGSGRFFIGRPFIFSAAVLVLLLGIWAREREQPLKPALCSMGLIAFAAYIHGGYYLFVLLPAALVLAGRFREAVYVGFAWLLGAILAGIGTGDPVSFVFLQVKQSLASVGSAESYRQLVSEFQPRFEYQSAVIVALVCIVQLVRGKLQESIKSPAFWLMIMGWILAMKNTRFWVDWGRVAMLVWMGGCFAEWVNLISRHAQPRRLATGLLACLAVWLVWTVDVSDRWSNQRFADRLNLSEHKEWLPGSGGIFYTDSMWLFYETFYENPEGDWRYILGFEAALMPEEDLKIFREIQLNPPGAENLFAPWVEKMRPEDRLVLRRGKSAKPEIPGLEWHYASYKTWVGRLPRS